MFSCIAGLLLDTVLYSRFVVHNGVIDEGANFTVHIISLMINRKLYLWSSITGISIMLTVLVISFLYDRNVLSHEGVDFVSLRMNGIFSGSCSNNYC